MSSSSNVSRPSGTTSNAVVDLPSIASIGGMELGHCVLVLSRLSLKLMNLRPSWVSFGLICAGARMVPLG